MIGRVLAFAVCVVVVVAENCNDNTIAQSHSGGDCCLGNDWNNQLSWADNDSLTPPVLLTTESTFPWDYQPSGFFGLQGYFQFVVRLPIQYFVSDGTDHPATGGVPYKVIELDGEVEEFWGMPRMRLGCMDNTNCPPDNVADAIGEWYTNDDWTVNCEFDLVSVFDFDTMASYLSDTPIGAPEADSAVYAYKYGAIELQLGTTVFGDIFKTVSTDRVVVETMIYKLKFQLTVTVNTQTTVTFAAIQHQIAIHLTRVSVPVLADYTGFKHIDGTECFTKLTEITDGNWSAYCGNIVTIKLTVGVSSLIPTPYVTTLFTDTDAYAYVGDNSPFTYQLGFSLRREDRNSGVRWIPQSHDNGQLSPRTVRVHNLNDQPKSAEWSDDRLDGTPGLFNTDENDNGITGCAGPVVPATVCTQKYVLFLEYSPSIHVPTYLQTTLGGDEDFYSFSPAQQETNTENDHCHLSGVEINIGNAAAYDGSDLGLSEIKCRGDISFEVDGGGSLQYHITEDSHKPFEALTIPFPLAFDGVVFLDGGSTGRNDDVCIFNSNGQDEEDNVDFKIVLSTANWCPGVTIQNDLEKFMSVDGPTKMAGSVLNLNIHVRSQPSSSPDQDAPNADANIVDGNSQLLKVDKLKVTSLVATCDPDMPSNLAASCNILGVGGNAQMQLAPEASGDPYYRNVGQIINGALAPNYGSDYDCIPDLAKNDDAHLVDDGWCTVQASLNLCEYVDAAAGGWTVNNMCYTNYGVQAFDIHNDYTYTNIKLIATVNVGYPGINVKRKAVKVEFSPHKDLVYRLLQNQSAEVDVSADVGFSSAGSVPASEAEQVDAETAGANNAVVEEAAVAESNSMLIYIIVGVFLFISVFVGALVMYLRRSKSEKKVHPVPITVEVNKSTAAMA